MFGWGLDIWDSWSFFKLLDTDGGGSIELEALEVGLGRLGRFQRLIFMYSDWPFMWTGNMLVYWMQTHPWSLTKKTWKCHTPSTPKEIPNLMKHHAFWRFLLLNFGEVWGFLWMPPSTWRNSLWVASDWVAMPVPWICAKFCRRPRGGGVKLPFLKCFPDPLPFNEGDLLVEEISETYWPAFSRRRMFFYSYLMYLYYISFINRVCIYIYIYMIHYLCND